MTALAKKDLVLTALLLLWSAIPTLGGVVRLGDLSAPATVDNARFVGAPAPIVIHVVCATLYAVLGAFQFAAGVRRRWPRWHRGAGRVLALCCVATGLSGLWMTALYDIPLDIQGPLLLGVRFLVGVAMVAAIVIALLGIRRRDVPRHEAFMIRAYALGQGAGTQVFVLGPWIAQGGEVVGLTRDVLMTLSWVINIAVAEWIIGRGKGALVASSSRNPGALAHEDGQGGERGGMAS